MTDVHVVNDLLSLRFTTEQLAAFSPPPDPIPGFITIFDCGWDILRLRAYCKDKGRIFCYQDLYDSEGFTKKQEEPRYRQIRIEAVEGSFSKSFDTQKALLPETEEVPFARQVLMGMVVHFLHTGLRLFPAYSVRCIDKHAGCLVDVGSFGDKGLDFVYYWAGHRSHNVGLASAKKL